MTATAASDLLLRRDCPPSQAFLRLIKPNTKLSDRATSFLIALTQVLIFHG
jgi:hypothetical protein